VVERSSGIQAVRPLNVAPTDEARLREYIATQLETQLSRAEAAAITAVYARLGLVPDTLDLGALLAALLEEQVIGYYDPVSDTLFVHDRVPTAELEPVLAHELVHALQDHLVDLDSIGRALEGSNDAVTAWQAVVEGHATFAMMEWQFSAMMGGEADLTELDDLGDMLSGIDLTALGDFGSTAVLAAAPAVIREGLIFPYVGGLVFLQRAWKERPSRPLPFGADRPLSTEQVLHVDRWLARDEPRRTSASSRHGSSSPSTSTTRSGPRPLPPGGTETRIASCAGRAARCWCGSACGIPRTTWQSS
jgi:hypothetical protein